MPTADLFEATLELSVDAMVELWVVDNTVNGGTTYRFHSSRASGTTQDLLHDGLTYSAAPIEVTGVETTSQGKPRPKMTIGTAAAVLLGLLSDPDLLLGATCTRIKTLAQYLDDGSAPDPTAIWPTAKFFIEQLEEYNDTLATYRLSDPTDLAGVKVPRQIVMANLCTTCYRGETCQYVGDPVTDSTGVSFGAGPFTDRGTWSDATSNYVADDYVKIDNPDGVPFVWVALQNVPAGLRPGSTGSSAYWKLDVCLKKLTDCELRFDGQSVGLPYDAFPGVAKIQ